MTHSIRRFMDAVSSLCEGKAVYRDHEFIVMLNPSKREYEHLVAKTNHDEGLRAIISMNDLYVWDSYFANHDETARKLSIAVDAELHLRRAYVELDAKGIDEEGDDDGYEAGSADDPVQQVADNVVRTNRCLRQIYGEDMRILAELGDGYRGV